MWKKVFRRDRKTPVNSRITDYKHNTKMEDTFKSKIAEHSWNENDRIQRGKLEIFHR
jgi:hypothetical protein